MENIPNIEVNENSILYRLPIFCIKNGTMKMYKDRFQLHVYSFIYLTELSSNLRIYTAASRYVVTAQTC
jgi:hypothetical protein